MEVEAEQEMRGHPTSFFEEEEAWSSLTGASSEDPDRIG
jgi:hypothetical protein